MSRGTRTMIYEYYSIRKLSLFMDQYIGLIYWSNSEQSNVKMRKQYDDGTFSVCVCVTKRIKNDSKF